ncbi:MAG: CoA-binding protein [Trueperaceae bacterium]|nr:CoA-binding protein [Trueperaceae bacterium]
MEPADADLRRILEESRVVAVLGASTKDEKPAHFVPAYLMRHGYRILPVNPAATGAELFGSAVRATLAELDTPVDVVDVFRRPADIPAHLPDLLAMRPLPKVVWFQQGIRNDAAAATLAAAGIEVVQDRCMLEEHERLVGAGAGRSPLHRGDARG